MTTTRRTPAVLLVEQHALIRAGLRSMINSIPGMMVVAEASSMAEAMPLAHRHLPDALLISSAAWDPAPGAASMLRSELPRTCVLVIGGDDSGGIELTSGYCCLPRDAGIREFCAAVATMLGGHCTGCESPLQCPAVLAVAALSRRERQVAVKVAEGLTSKQIAVMLGVALRTVSTYRESLARKIGASSAAALTRYVIESGLRDIGAVDGKES
jgi:DNA-binding NarL/FixJ family response regulator